MSAPQPEPPATSLADRAYRTIRDRLVMLDITPGSPLNDEQLAGEIGVGRTPVREALKRLESERLVVAHARRGTFATDVNITDLGHISEVRNELEPLAAASAARRASADDRAAITALLGEVGGRRGAAARARNSSELMRLDMSVHRAIYAATHNPYLEDTLIRYDNLATRIWCVFADRLPDLAGHVGEHGPLLRAIIAGDAARAATLSAEHVAHFEQAIRAVI